jgi:UDP-glucose 4-epimerase
LEEGFEVGVIDNLFSGTLENLTSSAKEKDFKFYNLDISDYDSLREVVRQYDSIVHQAALVSVTRSVQDPLGVNRVNVIGTLNLLRCAVNFNVKKFLYASSSSVYGEAKILPKKESMLTLPISPYAVSKLAGENYCRAFAKVYGLNTVCLRYFNVYGPRQRYGPYSGVIPTFIKRALDNEDLVIYGDGNQTRDFTHVVDVVNANILCLKEPVERGDVFNVATGNFVTINELARTILEIIGRPTNNVRHVAPREGDIYESYADISKIRRLGYQPKFTLKEGLKTVVDWLQLRRAPKISGP